MQRKQETKEKSTASFVPARVALPILLLILFMPAAHSQIYGPDSFCSSIINPQTSILNNAGSSPFNAIISTSLLILLLMLNISALMYLIGSALKIEKLTRFGRTEIGEVAVTAIVVLISLGTFAAVNLVSNNGYSLPPGNFLALSPGTLSHDLFYSDCKSLASASLTVLGDMRGVLAAQKFTELYQSYTWSFAFANEGISLQPWGGLSLAGIFLSNVANVGFGLLIVPSAIALVVGIFFALFPIFFYLGIILRTFPWTRAAGGAFLGLFIGFYVVFPLLLYLMISQVNVTQIQFNTQSAESAINSFANINPTSFVLPDSSLFGFGVAMAFFSTVAGQMFYIIFAIAIAFIISYDFMEFAGDLLGAPSLSSANTLKSII